MSETPKRVRVSQILQDCDELNRHQVLELIKALLSRLQLEDMAERTRYCDPLRR